MAPVSSGCSQRSGDAGMDVVPLLSHGTVIPILPSDAQCSKTSFKLLLGSLRRSGGHHFGGHHCGGHHLPALPPHSTFSSSPTPLCCFHRNHSSGKEGFFLTLWLFSSLSPQPVPIPAPDPTAPGGIPSLDPAGFHPWILLAARGCDPQPAALPQGGAAPSWS